MILFEQSIEETDPLYEQGSAEESSRSSSASSTGIKGRVPITLFHNDEELEEALEYQDFAREHLNRIWVTPNKPILPPTYNRGLRNLG